MSRLEFYGSGGIRLAGEAYGNAAHRPVLLAHGGGQTRHAWGNTAKSLAQAGFYAITLDLRGHGESAWCPDGDYRIECFAKDLVVVAETLGAPPVLIGASLGGIAGLIAEGELTSGGRSSFSALVLVDITPRVNPAGVERILGFMIDRAESGFTSIEEAAEAISAYLPHRPRPRSLEGLRKNLRRDADGRYRWHWDPRFVTGVQDRGRPRDPERLVAAAKNIEIPVLLVRGRLSELVSEDMAKEFLTIVPHAAYADVSDAGHMVAGDKNDAFTTAILQFLGKGAPICAALERP